MSEIKASDFERLTDEEYVCLTNGTHCVRFPPHHGTVVEGDLTIFWPGGCLPHCFVLVDGKDLSEAFAKEFECGKIDEPYKPIGRVRITVERLPEASDATA